MVLGLNLPNSSCYSYAPTPISANPNINPKPEALHPEYSYVLSHRVLIPQAPLESFD